MDFGFLKIGAFSPRTCVANPKQNAIYTLDALRHACLLYTSDAADD